MAGYDGYSMSNNAREAYANDEMPLSKWTKKAMLAMCGDKAELLKVLTAEELRKNFLFKVSWHHTSKFYNKTDFYAMDEDYISVIDEEDVARIIAARTPRSAKPRPKKITAQIEYKTWGLDYRSRLVPTKKREVVTFLANAKMVQTSAGNKRRSSIRICRLVEIA